MGAARAGWARPAGLRTALRTHPRQPRAPSRAPPSEPAPGRLHSVLPDTLTPARPAVPHSELPALTPEAALRAPPAAAPSGVLPIGHAHGPLRYHKGLNSRTVTVSVGSGQKGPSGKVTEVTPLTVKFHGWPLLPVPPLSHLLPKLVSSLLSRQRFISRGAAREASRGALL